MLLLSVLKTNFVLVEERDEPLLFFSSSMQLVMVGNVSCEKGKLAAIAREMQSPMFFLGNEAYGGAGVPDWE